MPGCPVLPYTSARWSRLQRESTYGIASSAERDARAPLQAPGQRVSAAGANPGLAGKGEAPSRSIASAGGLVVESTFTTLADMAREVTYAWVPVGLLLSQKFDSMSKMAKVTMPVLVVHGAADRFVPSRFSQQLYDAATAPKKLLLVEGGSHNNSMRAGADQYRQALGQLFGLGMRRAQGADAGHGGDG